MKVNNKRNVAANKTQSATQFTLKMNANTVRILVDKLYTKKTLAVIRELMANCIDATQANTSEKFTPINPVILIGKDKVTFEDNGPGMSDEFITEMYTTFFSSDKTDTNDQTGMFGLGSKSPFALTDQFRVYTTTQEDLEQGITRMYQCAIGTDGLPSIHTIGEIPNNNGNKTGTTIDLPIKFDTSELIEALELLMPVIVQSKVSVRFMTPDTNNYDMNQLKSILERIEGTSVVEMPHSDFHVLLSKNSYLKFSGAAIEAQHKVLAKAPNNPQYRAPLNGSQGYRRTNGMYTEHYGQTGLYVSMGSAVYAVSEDLLKEVYGEDKIKRATVYEFMGFFAAKNNKDRVIFNAPIGSFDLPPSRETIEITIRTKQFFQTVFLDALRDALIKINTILCHSTMDTIMCTQDHFSLRPIQRLEMITAAYTTFTGQNTHGEENLPIVQGLQKLYGLGEMKVQTSHSSVSEDKITYVRVPIKWHGTDGKILRKNKKSYEDFSSNWDYSDDKDHPHVFLFSNDVGGKEIQSFVNDAMARMLQTSRLKNIEVIHLDEKDERITAFVDDYRATNFAHKDNQPDDRPNNLLRTKRLQMKDAGSHGSSTISWQSHHITTEDRNDVVTGGGTLFDNEVPYFYIDNSGSTGQTSHDYEGVVTFLETYGDPKIIPNVTLYRVTLKQLTAYQKKKDFAWKPIFDLVFDTLKRNRSRIITHAALHSVSEVSSTSYTLSKAEKLVINADNVLCNISAYCDKLKEDGRTPRGRGTKYAKMLNRMMMNSGLDSSLSSCSYYQSGLKAVTHTAMVNKTSNHEARLVFSLRKNADEEVKQAYMASIKKVNGLDIIEYTQEMMDEIIDKMFTIIMVCNVIAKESPVFNYRSGYFFDLVTAFDILPVVETLKVRKKLT